MRGAVSHDARTAAAVSSSTVIAFHCKHVSDVDFSAEADVSAALIPSALKWRAKFAITLYRALKHDRIALILNLMTFTHVTNVMHIQSLWSIGHMEIYEAALRIILVDQLTAAQCRAGMINVKALAPPVRAPTPEWVRLFKGAPPSPPADALLPSQIREAASDSSQRAPSQERESAEPAENEAAAAPSRRQERVIPAAEGSARITYDQLKAKLKESRKMHVFLALRNSDAEAQLSELRTNRGTSIAGKDDELALHMPLIWLRDCKPLDMSLHGHCASVGTAQLLTQSHLVQTAKKKVRIPEHICFYKQTYVLEEDMIPYFTEVSILAAIRAKPHINLPTVYGVAGMSQAVRGEDDETHQTTALVVATEYLRGVSLAVWFASGLNVRHEHVTAQIRLRELFGIMLQIVHGVRHLQSIGVIHRDIQPGNVMLLSPEIYKHLVSESKLRVISSGSSADSLDEDALRACHRDGYAPGFDIQAAPTVSAQRVVIIDFNVSLLRCSMPVDLEDAISIEVGTREYGKRSFHTKSGALGIYQQEPPAAQSATEYWMQYDHYGLALTLVDVLRGVQLAFKEEDDSIIAEYHEYCIACLNAALVPSLVAFFTARSGACGGMENDDEFAAANAAFQPIALEYPSLMHMLSCMTCERWTKSEGGIRTWIQEPQPTLQALETELVNIILKLESEDQPAVRDPNGDSVRSIDEEPGTPHAQSMMPCVQSPIAVHAEANHADALAEHHSIIGDAEAPGAYNAEAAPPP
jgi:serine/threonine protein kinase